MINKIISGGQTGVDRAALDAAIALEIPHEGWCPNGRRAEDGPISKRYHLKETPSPKYEERTEWNVRDSDGTLIMLYGKPTGGTLLTINIAKNLKKPYFIYELGGKLKNTKILIWLRQHKIKVLNIAGPRETKAPGIYKNAHKTLSQLLPIFYLSTNTNFEDIRAC